MEMLRNFVIFSLCLVATRADGEFSVLISPRAVSFTGDSPIESQYVGDVLNAAMGNSADINAQWDGLTITDPFSLADRVIVIIVCGIDGIELSTNAKKYQMLGDSIHVSLFALSVSLEMDHIPMCNLDLVYFDEAVKKFGKCFGDTILPVLPTSEILQPEVHNIDHEYLQSIGYINAAAENFAIMRQKSSVMLTHLSLEGLRDVHGDDTDVVNEAGKLAADAIESMYAAIEKSGDNDILVVVISQQAEESSRRKRSVTGTTKEKKNAHNIATYYNQDYPVIFNIILWFMVAFGLSLLAICYAIGDMDPGRDSIIYRMTSTRLKKEY